MPVFNIPEWAHTQRRSDPFKLMLKSGGIDSKPAATLASHDYILVTQGKAVPSTSDPCNVLFIEHVSVSKGHAAFVRHKRNGGIYCIDLGAQGGTFINGIRCIENKPIKVAPGSVVRFGDFPLKYMVAGVELAVPSTLPTIEDKTIVAIGDKENAKPQETAKNQVEKLQRGPLKHRTSTPPPSLPSSKIISERMLQEQSLQSLLPQTSRRDAEAALKFELPKSMKAVLQVKYGADMLVVRFSSCVSICCC
jgi:hypothetical protein